MIETLTVLLAGHLAGDFLLQTDAMVRRKRELPFLGWHAAIVTLVTALFCGSMQPLLLVAVFLLHLLIDLIKTHGLGDELRGFLLDQALHLLSLLAIASLFPSALADGFWPLLAGPESLPPYLAAVTLLNGLVLCLPFGALLVEKATASFMADLTDQGKGLPEGGRTIGLLERFLVFVFTFLGEFAAVGFLLTAKSILRFGEIRNSADRKATEYIIIGTFLSIGWALTIALGTRGLWHFWFGG